MQSKAEKTAEIKRQTQLVSATEFGRAKSNEGQGNNVGMVHDTTKENEEQSNNVPEVLDACSNKEQPNKVATQGWCHALVELGNEIASGMDFNLNDKFDVYNVKKPSFVIGSLPFSHASGKGKRKWSYGTVFPREMFNDWEKGSKAHLGWAPWC